MHVIEVRNKRIIWNALLAVLVVGVFSYAIEHFGEGHLSALTSWIAAEGNFAPAVFMLINITAMILVLPQTLFTVVAGVLFGVVKGTAISLASMAVGSSLAFILGRFVFRGRILQKYGSDSNFVKLEMLSRRHSIKVLALSRIVPVVPYSVANYLWSVTGVKFFPYLVMSVICLIPETVFLTAGGHILSAGVTKGTMDWELPAVLLAAGLVIVVLVRAVRRSLDQDNEDGEGNS